MRSVFYSNIQLYRLMVRLMYGKDYNSRYQRIADLVTENSSVLEICPGDCYLYLKYLSKKNIVYQGIDANEIFLNYAQKRGITVLNGDIRKSIPLPNSDVVVMQASLYQFIPDQEVILNKLLKLARKKLIVSEPVVNFGSSNNLLVKTIADKLSQPGIEISPHRFNRKKFINLIGKYQEYKPEIIEPSNSREIIAVFKIK